MAEDLTIEPVGEANFGPCECCGLPTRRVWGFVHSSDRAEASYFVEWTPGAVLSHGAFFDLIVGRWGEGTTAKDRAATSLQLRHTERGPEFMVVDAAGRPHAKSDLVSTVLERDDVIGTPKASLAFKIVDAIWLQDDRISEVVSPAG